LPAPLFCPTHLAWGPFHILRRGGRERESFLAHRGQRGQLRPSALDRSHSLLFAPRRASLEVGRAGPAAHGSSIRRSRWVSRPLPGGRSAP